jgi:hypothetical protein
MLITESCPTRAPHGANWDAMRLRALAASAALVCAAVTFANPAHADDFSGTYTRTGPLADQSTWVVTPCGDGCAHIADSSGWSADAHPFGGLWTFTVAQPVATICNNDGTLPGTVTFKVDAAGQRGTALFNTSPAPTCQWGLAPGFANPVFFTLTRV